MSTQARSLYAKPHITPQDRYVLECQDVLASVGAARKIVEFRESETIYSQGDRASTVLYIQRGRVKLSVVNQAGKEGVVAILGAGDFVGEGPIVGQPFRMRMATAITAATLLVIEKNEMIRVLHTDHTVSDHFISYLISRNFRSEGDLIDQLFNSSEKRLARALLILANYGSNGPPTALVPHVTQEVLAEMIGTTRSRVNYFMNQFIKKGFIEYNGGLHVNSSLLSVVLEK